MKRFLLSLACCFSMIVYSSSSFSLNLIGPSDDEVVLSAQYGPVSEVETLWRVATKLRPDTSVSIQQTLLAIYKINPNAFLAGNINKIIPNSILQVPDYQFIQQQTDQEAGDLINKYSGRKKAPKKVIAPQPSKPPVTAVKNIVPAKVVAPIKTVKPLITKKIEQEKELLVVENKLQALQKDFDALDEELIEATEKNQILKVKLQPLYDQLNSSKDQIKDELQTHEELQKIIDDYRIQLDAVKARPFSGDGLLNQILRLITSSLTNLLIVIVSPVLFLLLVIVVLMRLNSKRQLAAQEQELAESTANLMEEEGKFDSLLTDDIIEKPEVDLTKEDPSEQNSDQDEQSISLEDELESIDLTETESTENEDTALQSDEDDPFALDVLAEEEPLAGDEDDPFGISSLSADDPFGIEALAEEEDLIANVSLDDSEIMSDSDQSDLDLAAEWEKQISEQDDDSEDLDSHIQQTDLDASVEEESLEISADDPFGIAALAEEEDLTANVSPDDSESMSEPDEEIQDLDSHIQQAEALEVATEEPDFNEIDDILASIDIDDSDTIVEQEAEKEEIAETPIDEPKEPEPSEIDDILASIDIDDSDAIVEQEAVEEEIAETPIDEPKEPEPSEIDDILASIDIDDSDAIVEQKAAEQEEPNDLLAKQLSDVAFKEDVPLPKIDTAEKNDFIDIETLLESSDKDAKDEPYSEFDIDLGLDEFPDVIDTENNKIAEDGENEVSAQLDLARAYLEIDDKAGAKEILLSVIEESAGAQRAEIEKLLSRLA